MKMIGLTKYTKKGDEVVIVNFDNVFLIEEHENFVRIIFIAGPRKKIDVLESFDELLEKCVYAKPVV